MGMEWVIQLAAVATGILLSVVWAWRLDPNNLSEFELHRQINAGHGAAKAEQQRRLLLPTYQALRSLKEIILVVVLAMLLVPTHPWFGGVLFFAYLCGARAAAAQGWFGGWVGKIQAWYERRFSGYVQKLAPFLIFLAPKKVFAADTSIASRDELRQLIATDTTLLSPDDKARLLGAFDFGTLTVADAMVERDHIVTVSAKETVGPLLLDRLHKANHRVFVVIKKDIDHIQGLLYMHDLTPLHPDIKEVKDALRPTVHYVHAQAPLQDILGASLLTGRQLFIAVDDQGATKGLITLADALRFLCGQALPSAAPVSTKPIIT